MERRLDPDKYLEEEFVKAQLNSEVSKYPRHPDPCIADILDRLERVEAALFGKKKETR